METISAGASAFVVIVLVFALAGKASTLTHGSSAWHPMIIVSPWRRKYATALVSLAAAIEVVTLISLVWIPKIGAFMGCALMAAYGAASRDVAGHCKCLGALFDAHTRKGLLLRNSVISIACLAILPNAPRFDAFAVVPLAVWILAAVFAARVGSEAGDQKPRVDRQGVVTSE